MPQARLECGHVVQLPDWLGPGQNYPCPICDERARTEQQAFMRKQSAVDAPFGAGGVSAGGIFGGGAVSFDGHDAEAVHRAAAFGAHVAQGQLAQAQFAALNAAPSAAAQLGTSSELEEMRRVLREQQATIDRLLARPKANLLLEAARQAEEELEDEEEDDDEEEEAPPPKKKKAKKKAPAKKKASKKRGG